MLIDRSLATGVGAPDASSTAPDVDRLPDVSIVIPACNAERYLPETIESVVRQTHSNFELIIVDDGSTDRTVEIARAYADIDPRIIVISGPNTGGAVARNTGYERARGKWVLNFDADDVMLRTLVADQLAFVQSQPGLVAAGCLPVYTSRSGRELGAQYSDLLTPRDMRRYIDEGRELSIPHPGSMFRRDVVSTIGGYRPALLPVEDLDIINRLGETGGLVLVNPKHLFKYRIHGGSTSVSQRRRTALYRRWAIACIHARRDGRPEPTLEEHIRHERSEGWLKALERHASDLGYGYYKAATAAYGAGHHFRLALYLIGAIAFTPGNATRQIWRRWVKPRLAGANADRIRTD